MMKRLAGEWKALELICDGQKMQDDWLAYGTRTNTGNETKIVFGGQTMVHAKMRVDEKVEPVTVDYLNLAGADQPRHHGMDGRRRDLPYSTAGEAATG